MSSDEPYWKGMPDSALVTTAGSVGPGDASRATVITMLRLRDALIDQQTVANALGQRITVLNMWLLWVTAAVGALTLVQAAVGVVQLLIAFKFIGR